MKSVLALFFNKNEYIKVFIIFQIRKYCGVRCRPLTIYVTKKDKTRSIRSLYYDPESFFDQSIQDLIPFYYVL